jgi:hypothetical protein
VAVRLGDGEPGRSYHHALHEGRHGGISWSGNGMAMASQATHGLATLCGLANQMRDKQIFYSEANVFPQIDARDVMGEYT